MSTRALLLDTAGRMFGDHCTKALLDATETGTYPEALHALLLESGFLSLARPDSGATLGDALAVLRVAGEHALPVPLAEIILANRWLDVDTEFVSVGIAVNGEAHDVPWGRRAEVVLAVDEQGAVTVLEDLTVEPATNLAGEPRDRVRGARTRPLAVDEDAWALMALTRAVLMAGGLTRALEMALNYAGEREQFGRPIGKFQAIQHMLAGMAAETAAGIRAADAGLDAIGSDRFAEEVAAARSRLGEAVTRVAEQAHQVHGAMGYTHEHALHHTTRRLWSWRDEYGSEVDWQTRLGDALIRRVDAAGADALWDFVASRS